MCTYFITTETFHLHSLAKRGWLYSNICDWCLYVYRTTRHLSYFRESFRQLGSHQEEEEATPTSCSSIPFNRQTTMECFEVRRGSFVHVFQGHLAVYYGLNTRNSYYYSLFQLSWPRYSCFPHTTTYYYVCATIQLLLSPMVIGRSERLSSMDIAPKLQPPQLQPPQRVSIVNLGPMYWHIPFN